MKVIHVLLLVSEDKKKYHYPNKRNVCDWDSFLYNLGCTCISAWGSLINARYIFSRFGIKNKEVLLKGYILFSCDITSYFNSGKLTKIFDLKIWRRYIQSCMYSCFILMTLFSDIYIYSMIFPGT